MIPENRFLLLSLIRQSSDIYERTTAAGTCHPAPKKRSEGLETAVAAGLAVTSIFAGIADVDLVLFPDLLAQIALVAYFANLMKLRFQPIHVLFLILQQPLEQFP